MMHIGTCVMRTRLWNQTEWMRAAAQLLMVEARPQVSLPLLVCPRSSYWAVPAHLVLSPNESRWRRTLISPPLRSPTLRMSIPSGWLAMLPLGSWRTPFWTSGIPDNRLLLVFRALLREWKPALLYTHQGTLMAASRAAAGLAVVAARHTSGVMVGPARKMADAVTPASTVAKYSKLQQSDSAQAKPHGWEAL